MRILIIGGHLSPALSVIEELKKKGEEDILFVGRKYAFEGDRTLSLEYKMCQSLGIKFAEISTGRLQRSFTKFTIPSLLKIPRGFRQAYKIVNLYKPDVVVGFGGYVQVPVILSASLLKIPSVIHEQTLEAGSANKIASRFASKICISFETSKKFFPRGKTILTGNPIRSEIRNPKSSIELSPDSLPLIYITGGSLGSMIINNLVEKSLRDLLRNFRIVHQTGGFNNLESLTRLRKIKKTLGNNLRSRYMLSDHFSSDEVGVILRAASLIIGRSGINTISEILYLNKPALLIPLEGSGRGEQKKNAQFLKDLGLAEVVNEKITPSEFVSAINHMARNLEKYKNSQNREYLRTNSASDMAEVILDVSR